MCNDAHRAGISRYRAVVSAAAMIAFAHVAHAQLPGVPLPNLPRVELPVTVTNTVTGVTNDLDVQRLTDLRRLRVRDLLRTQRATVERDPRGEPILRAEIVAFSPSDAAMDAARAAGFTIARERALEGLDARVVVLRAPERVSTRRALASLRTLDPTGAYDYNHLYTDSGAIGPFVRATTPRAHVRLAQSDPAAGPTAVEHDPSRNTRIGLVDGGVDTSHAVFHDAVIHQHGCADKPVPSAHGTAVASLLAGNSTLFHGAAPGAELFAADVYCGLGNGGAVDAVVDAIAWIAHEQAPVINVSLIGPRNLTLENVVRLVIARGYIVVAAVGNDGPAAPPLYPAAYPGVVGVTGVDAHDKALLEAGRGPQVDFAAPGADMAAAMLSPSYAAVRGTSFAAPLVAGLLAAQMREPDPAAAAKAISTLAQQAADLGSRGVDRTYGNGLVGNKLRTLPALALVGAPAGTPKN